MAAPTSTTFSRVATAATAAASPHDKPDVWPSGGLGRDAVETRLKRAKWRCGAANDEPLLGKHFVVTNEFGRVLLHRDIAPRGKWESSRQSALGGTGTLLQNQLRTLRHLARLRRADSDWTLQQRRRQDAALVERASGRRRGKGGFWRDRTAAASASSAPAPQRRRPFRKERTPPLIVTVTLHTHAYNEPIVRLLHLYKDLAEVLHLMRLMQQMASPNTVGLRQRFTHDHSMTRDENQALVEYRIVHLVALLHLEYFGVDGHTVPLSIPRRGEHGGGLGSGVTQPMLDEYEFFLRSIIAIIRAPGASGITVGGWEADSLYSRLTTSAFKHLFSIFWDSSVMHFDRAAGQLVQTIQGSRAAARGMRGGGDPAAVAPSAGASVDPSAPASSTPPHGKLPPPPPPFYRTTETVDAVVTVIRNINFGVDQTQWEYLLSRWGLVPGSSWRWDDAPVEVGGAQPASSLGGTGKRAREGMLQKCGFTDRSNLTLLGVGDEFSTPIIVTIKLTRMGFPLTMVLSERGFHAMARGAILSFTPTVVNASRGIKHCTLKVSLPPWTTVRAVRELVDGAIDLRWPRVLSSEMKRDAKAGKRAKRAARSKLMRMSTKTTGSSGGGGSGSGSGENGEGASHVPVAGAPIALELRALMRPSLFLQRYDTTDAFDQSAAVIADKRKALRRHCRILDDETVLSANNRHGLGALDSTRRADLVLETTLADVLLEQKARRAQIHAREEKRRRDLMRHSAGRGGVRRTGTGPPAESTINARAFTLHAVFAQPWSGACRTETREHVTWPLHPEHATASSHFDTPPAFRHMVRGAAKGGGGSSGGAAAASAEFGYGDDRKRTTDAGESLDYWPLGWTEPIRCAPASHRSDGSFEAVQWPAQLLPDVKRESHGCKDTTICDFRATGVTSIPPQASWRKLDESQLCECLRCRPNTNVMAHFLAKEEPAEAELDPNWLDEAHYVRKALRRPHYELGPIWIAGCSTQPLETPGIRDQVAIDADYAATETYLRGESSRPLWEPLDASDATAGASASGSCGGLQLHLFNTSDPSPCWSFSRSELHWIVLDMRERATVTGIRFRCAVAPRRCTLEVASDLAQFACPPGYCSARRLAGSRGMLREVCTWECSPSRAVQQVSPGTFHDSGRYWRIVFHPDSDVAAGAGAPNATVGISWIQLHRTQVSDLLLFYIYNLCMTEYSNHLIPYIHEYYFHRTQTPTTTLQIAALKGHFFEARGTTCSSAFSLFVRCVR